MIQIHTLQGGGLKNMMKILSSTMSTEATRYYLNGVALRKRGDSVYFCSTDGHRLTKIDLENEYVGLGTSGVKDSKDFSYIIPAPIIKLLLRMPIAKRSIVQITIDKNKVEFKVDDIQFSSTLIDGTYPEIETVIPEEAEDAIAFEKKYVKQFLSLAALEETVIFQLPKMEDGSFNNASPTLIKTTKGATYVIMPKRF